MLKIMENLKILLRFLQLYSIIILHIYAYKYIQNYKTKISPIEGSSMDLIYLDNSATTPICEEAIKSANDAMKINFGNPSSLYSLGLDAERLIEKARETMAKKINAAPKEIIFTSCGTESNNTAIFGAVKARRKQGKRIVTTEVEHPSVAEPIKELEAEGFEVVRLPVYSDGRVSADDIKKAITKDTIFVSIMAVNNETGAIMPLEAVSTAIKAADSPAIFHTDAVQAFGKIKIDVKRLGIDFLSASGHKLHAPKGVGFLYKSEKIHIKPYFFGGGQEKGMRSGTECVPLISAFASAVSVLPKEEETLQKMRELRNFALEKLSRVEGVLINSHESALPYIINISLDGIRSETALHFLENMGIYVSSGSACSKGKASSVLTQMGLSFDRADSALRISMSRFTSFEDIEKLAEGIASASARLTRKHSRR